LGAHGAPQQKGNAIKKRALRGKEVTPTGLSLLQSQLPICFAERNGAFDLASRVENTDFTGAEARAAVSVVDCLPLLWEHRLNAWRFKNFPAAFPGLLLNEHKIRVDSDNKR
jgi:hypothetical protein